MSVIKNYYEQISLIAPILILLVLAVIIYELFYKELFYLRGKISDEERTLLQPAVLKSGRLLITLSSASLILSFSVLGLESLDLEKIKYLRMAWLFFTLTIVFGVVVEILSYTFNLTASIFKKDIKEELEKSKDIKKSTLKRIYRIAKLEKYFFLLSFVQLLLFLLAILYLLFSLLSI